MSDSGKEGSLWIMPFNFTVLCGSIDFRVELMRDWCKVCTDLNIPSSENFNFVKVLGFDINIQYWNICGLPRDEFSIQNAIILEYTDR